MLTWQFCCSLPLHVSFWAVKSIKAPHLPVPLTFGPAPPHVTLLWCRGSGPQSFNICWTDVRAACSWTWRQCHMLHWHTCVEDHHKVTWWPLHTVRTGACQELTLSNISHPEVTKNWDGLEDEVKSSCWDKCLHKITQTVQHNRPKMSTVFRTTGPKCPLSSGHHLSDTFCPLSLLGTSHQQLFPSMLLFREACYSLPLVVVLRWWSRTYNNNLHLRLYKTSSGQFSIQYGKMFMKQFPQRLKDALLFIESSSYCKCLTHFSSGCFHDVKLVILFFYLHQGPDVSTCLFARGKKTWVMISVKSVDGCLLSIKAETSRNRTFLSEMFFFS